MHTKCLAFVIVLAGCPDIPSTKTPEPTPTVEFDPANSIVPFPNNLVLDPTTHKVNLPMQACESAAQTAIRTGVLNTLDGFGTYETAMTFTTTVAPDAGTVTTTGAAPSIVMYKIASGTTAVNPMGAQPVPIGAAVTQSLRFDMADCSSPAVIPTVGVEPLVPLDEHATYVVAVLDTLQANGAAFDPSSTWALVRQPTEPVTLDASGNVITNLTGLDPAVPAQLAQLQGLDQVWKLHAPALQFLDATGALGTPADRHHVLVAWTFTTQTTTDPLDPTVPGLPANTAATAQPQGKLLGTFSLPKKFGVNAQTFLAGALPAGACNAIPCDQVGDVFEGGLVSTQYQVLEPNPNPDGGNMVPGAWTDPVMPTPQFTSGLNATLTFIAVIPKGAVPASGWPVVIFGHGLGSEKETLLAIAPQLAQAGFASIAIDFQASGSRAVQIDTAAADGCAGTCQTGGAACTKACAITGNPCINGLGEAIDPTVVPQCYASILSTDLATTRDNIRQTVLDLEQLSLSAKACGVSGCPSDNGDAFSVDVNHVGYMGISLGGIIGSTTSAVAGFQASVLNVAAMGLVDILENTETDEIKCPLVNQLIALGVVTGVTWDPANPSVGECTTDDWKTQPGYQQFAGIARWVLDPADGANFAAKLALRKLFLMEVDGDMVVPNVATNNEGHLLFGPQMDPATGDGYNPLAANTASTALLANITNNNWLKYVMRPATDPTTGGFGNLFQHASLLQPAPSVQGHCVGDPVMTCTADSDCATSGNVCIFPGSLGTARVQLDAITYLGANVQ
jgi:dienelactone hydrolase